jgi:CTP synthase (UTP-ammonia lyase)
MAARCASSSRCYNPRMGARPGPSIGIIGDYSPNNPTHRFTNEALARAGLNSAWVPTDTVGDDPARRLADFAGLWIAPGSPYTSMDGALHAIRYARERGVPLVGT